MTPHTSIPPALDRRTSSLCCRRAPSAADARRARTHRHAHARQGPGRCRPLLLLFDHNGEAATDTMVRGACP
eukprot:356249-Chlamydomonas_euryale.AAC.2